MALTKIVDPAFAGITEVDKRRNNYAPMAVFNKPVWQEMLFYQSSKWWLQSFINRYCGETPPIAANTWNWTEIGKFYKKQTIHASTATVDNGSGNFTITLNETVGYFVPTDVIDTGIAYPTYTGVNTLARVASIGTGAGGVQTLVVDLIDPKSAAVGVIVAGDFVANNQISLIYNSQGECFQAPSGRIYTPGNFSNSLTKISNTHEACDDAINQVVWFRNSINNQNYWVYEEQYVTMELHRMQSDSALVYGQTHSFTESGTSYAGVGGQGLIPFLSYGSIVRTYSGSVIEQDLIDLLELLGIFSKYDKWHLICGPTLYKDALVALKPYHTGGGVFYGEFPKSDRFGINAKEYWFGNKKLVLMEYSGFADPDFIPQNANGVDYTNLGMVLNLEGDSIKCVYKKKNNGKKIKDYLNWQAGLTVAGDGEQYTNDRACDKTVYTTHVGIEMKGMNNHSLIAGV